MSATYTPVNVGTRATQGPGSGGSGGPSSSQLDQMIQQAMDSVLTTIPSNNGGMSQPTFDNSLYAQLVNNGMTPAQAQAAVAYLQGQNYGGAGIGIGGGIQKTMPSLLQQVQNKWAPGAANAAGQASPTTATNVANTSQNAYAPSTISSQFPNGIPQMTAPQITGTQQSPQQLTSSIEAYMLPQFQQQNQALSADLANAGIVGGTTAQAQQAQGQGQQTALMNAIQPYILQNQQLGENTQQFNAGELTGGQQFNINNLLNTAGSNSSTWNQMLQYIMGLQNQDYLGQLGAASNLASGAEGTASNGFSPVFQQPSTTGLSGLGSAFGSAFNTTTPSTPTSNPSAPGGANYMYGAF